MDLLLDSSRLLNLSSFNSLLFENSRDKLIPQFDTFATLGTLNQPVSLQLWVVALISACIVGMVGLIPLCFIPFTLDCISSEKNGNISNHFALFWIVIKRIIILFKFNYLLNRSVKAPESDHQTLEKSLRLRIAVWLGSDLN